MQLQTMILTTALQDEKSTSSKARTIVPKGHGSIQTQKVENVFSPETWGSLQAAEIRSRPRPKPNTWVQPTWFQEQGPPAKAWTVQDMLQKGVPGEASSSSKPGSRETAFQDR